MNRGRLEMFSDGVFAVAITLLALNLTVPGPGHGPLTGQLAGQWQAFVAYLISFFTIGIVWVDHHALLSSTTAVTRSLLFFNLVLLLFVVLIPAATKLLAEYLTAGGFGAHLAAAVYGTVLEGMMIGFALLVEWALREEGRTQPPVPPDQRRAARVRNLRATVVFLLVIGSAFINALLALGLSGAIAVYFAFEQTPWLRTGDKDSVRPDEPGDAQRQRAGVLMGQIRDLQDKHAEDIFRLVATRSDARARAGTRPVARSPAHMSGLGRRPAPKVPARPRRRPH